MWLMRIELIQPNFRLGFGCAFKSPSVPIASIGPDIKLPMRILAEEGLLCRSQPTSRSQGQPKRE